MEPQIVLGEIAPAAADFADLPDAAGTDGDAGTNGGAIALCANEFEENAVIALIVLVEQQRGRFADVEQDYIDVAGVEDVAEGCAAARFERKVGEASFFGNFIERAVAVVALQKNGLAVMRTFCELINLRVDVAARD